MFRRQFLTAGGGVLVGSSIAGSAQAQESSKSWRMFQYDITGPGATNQGFGGEGPAADPPPDIRWRFDTDGPLHAGPAVVDDIAYFGSEDEHVYAVEDGTERWRYPTTAPVTSTPAVMSDRVYVSSDDGLVRALDATTGALCWCTRISGDVSSPLLVGDTIYITGGDRVYALNRADGTEQWHVTLEAVSRRGSTLAVTPTSVYVSGSEYVYAFEADTGAERWRYRPDDGQGVLGTPPVLAGPQRGRDVDVQRVYVISGSNRVHEIEAADGSQRAVFGDEASHIAADGERVYVQHTEGLTAYDHPTSEWSFTIDPGSGMYPATASNPEGIIVYYGDPPGEHGGSTLHALNATANGGTEWWRINLDVDLPQGGSLAVSNGILYAPTTAGQLLAVG